MTSLRAGLLGLLAVLAALVVPVGPVGAADDPASTCPDTGARVVVEFGDLAEDESRQVRVACDDEVSGERADRTLRDAGIDLTYATRSAGFVCRVEGVPTSDPCVHAAGADAYWSVWWARPGGDWVYSALGVTALRTPVGGDVALVWHRGDGKAQPPTPPPGSAVDDPAPVPADGSAEVETDAGLPTWVPVAVVLGVLILGGVVVLRRRNG